MTPHDDPKPLTEKELLQWKAELETVDAGYVEGKWDGAVLVLIDELRRARARIAELEEEVETLREERDTFRYQALLARRQP